MIRHKRSAFTLIELLVVVAIIGLISTLIFVYYPDVLRKSRDTQRVHDIDQIQTALEAYRLAEGQYPAALTPGQALMGSTSSTTYMQVVPSNPQPWNDGNCTSSNYIYTTTNNGYGYQIKYCLSGTTGYTAAGNKCVGPGGTTACITAPIPVFDPTTISGLKLWLDAGDPNYLFTSTFCTIKVSNSSDPVACWGDKSGNNYNAIQAIRGNQPLYITNVLNGKPVVRFNGSSSYLNGVTIPGLNSTSMSIFVVMSGASTALSDWSSPFNIGCYPSQFAFARWLSNGTFEVANTGMGSAGLYSTPGSFPNSGFPYTVFEYVKNFNVASTIYANGAYLNSVASGAGFTNGNYSIGENNGGCYYSYYAGDIAEMIIYNSALSTADRQSVENYLKTKYGL